MAVCRIHPDELCMSLFDGEELGSECLKLHKPETLLLGAKLNCSRMAEDLHFITSPLSKEEEEYPLAYIITIHKELEMFIRLLRAIYAPQNAYCIHVDDKSPEEYKAAVRSLADCFPNVFLASNAEKVDFPTKTNHEIIQNLQGKQWRGKSITPGVKQPPTMSQRTQNQHKEIMNPKESHVQQLNLKKGRPPHDLVLYFGTAYYSLTRPFVEFVLKDQRAKDLLEWSKDTYSPDEHYWVTLNRLPGAPGADPEAGWEGNIRSIKWRDQEKKAHDGCKGHYIRDICVYGPGDLKWVIEQDNMFANKFELETYPLAVVCMERWHRLKVLEQANVTIKPAWQLQNESYIGMRLNASIEP
ncbi:UNVERIFIED_CONTAM: hypothetical protein FKN15_062692 [Acipenser sinensis]